MTECVLLGCPPDLFPDQLLDSALLRFLLVQPGQYVLIGNLIEDYFISTGDWNFGSAISLIMAIIILISMYFTRKFDYDKEAV